VPFFPAATKAPLCLCACLLYGVTCLSGLLARWLFAWPLALTMVMSKGRITGGLWRKTEGGGSTLLYRARAFIPACGMCVLSRAAALGRSIPSPLLLLFIYSVTLTFSVKRTPSSPPPCMPSNKRIFCCQLHYSLNHYLSLPSVLPGDMRGI